MLQVAKSSGTHQTIYLALLMVSSRWMESAERCPSLGGWLSLSKCLLLASRSRHSCLFFDLALKPLLKILEHVQGNCLYQSKQTAPLIQVSLILFNQILQQAKCAEARDHLALLQHPSLYSVRELHVPLADCLAAGLKASREATAGALQKAFAAATEVPDGTGTVSAGFQTVVWLLRRCLKHAGSDSQAVSSLKPMDQVGIFCFA